MKVNRSDNRTRTNKWLVTLAHDAKPDIEECIEHLGHHIDWLNKLKNTPQDPEWHAEGNVHIHTNMVLQRLYDLFENEASHLVGEQRQALILGALLHDVGKTIRTKEIVINGKCRVASPQHEAIGRSYLAFKLMALELSFEVVWNILGLVGEHHMPKRLVIRNDVKAAYLSLSRRANIELLYWLEVADMRGRICPDLTSQLEYLEEFKMFAEEYGVWTKSFDLTKEFLTLFSEESNCEKDYIYSHAMYGMENGLISFPVEAIAKCYEHKSHYSDFFVLCGPSGSGKSTWVQNNCKDYALISLDNIRKELNGNQASQKNKGQVLHLAKERLKDALRTKQNVVWDATNLRSDFRKILCDLGRDYNALVSLIMFVIPEDELLSNNNNRDLAIPQTVLSKQLKGFQFPLVNEAHRVSVVGRKGLLVHRTGYFDHEWLKQGEL